MNSRIFLVLTVHKVAAAAKFAITARAGKKADADPLADLPTADARSHRVNVPDDLVAGNTRIGNAGETSLDCRGVRVANTARLDANAHLVVAGILKRPPHFSELSWFPYLNGFVGLTHFSRSHSFSSFAVRPNWCELGCQSFNSVAMTGSLFSPCSNSRLRPADYRCGPQAAKLDQPPDFG